MTTYTERIQTDVVEPIVIRAKTLKEARRQACGMLDVSGPRGLTFDADNGSGFTVSLYDGEDSAWDAAGRTIPGKRLVIR
jgi:hypothetical protein